MPKGERAGTIIRNLLEAEEQKLTGKALDKEISRAWSQHASGVQVGIMDMPKIFKDIKDAYAQGTSLEDAIRAAAEKYGKAEQAIPDFDQALAHLVASATVFNDKWKADDVASEDTQDLQYAMKELLAQFAKGIPTSQGRGG